MTRLRILMHPAAPSFPEEDIYLTVALPAMYQPTSPAHATLSHPSLNKIWHCAWLWGVFDRTQVSLGQPHLTSRHPNSMSELEGSSPFPEAPSPWSCKGEAFWFFGYFSPPKGYYPPKSAFSDLEGASDFVEGGATGIYKGGLTTIMIVRYSETPVGACLWMGWEWLWSHHPFVTGPYDELIWNPGKFHSPATNSDGLRITRIYVSSLDSVYNGGAFS